MELEIIEREEQALVDREEITVEISHAGEATPSAAAVRDKIAAELDLDPKTVEIAAIRSSTGLSTSTGTVRVHDEPVHDELPEAADEDAGVDEDKEEETVDEDESESAGEADGDAGEVEGEDEPAEDEENQEDIEDDGEGEDHEEEEAGEETGEKDGDA